MSNLGPRARADTEAIRVVKLAAKGRPVGEARQVRLKLRHLSVWSAVKVGFLLGIAFGVVNIIVTVIGWLFLDSFGTFGQLDSLITTVMGTTKGVSVASIITLPAAVGLAFIGSVLIVIGFSIIGLIAALLYNLSVRFTGGLLAGFTDR